MAEAVILSSSLDLSWHSIPLCSIADFMGTTRELLKDGGMDVVETLQSMMFSDTYRNISTAWTQESTFILSMSPVLRILQMNPCKASMDLPISYYCLPINLPSELLPFIINSQSALSAMELRHYRSGTYS